MAIAPKYNTARSQSPMYFGALDGFRGLLALFVAIYHTYWPSFINGSAFFENGPVIIDLFFVFSGFLLFTLYAGKIRSDVDAAKFLKKRFARLYPLHLFTLGLFLVFVCFRLIMHAFGFATQDAGEILPFQPGANEGWGTLLSNLTLFHSMGLHDNLSFNAPSWTVSVEFFAYFTFAAFLLWVPPKKSWHFGLLGLGVAAIYVYLSALKPDMNITHDYGFLRCLAGFYTGVVVSYVFTNIKGSETVTKIGFKTASIIEVLTVLGSTAFVIYCPGKLQFWVAPVLFVFVLVFSFDRGIVSKFMMRGVFRYLAMISYSVYMVHMLFAVIFYIFASKVMLPILGAEWFVSGINGDLYLIPYLLTVICVSHFTYKYVEIKGARFVMALSWSKSKMQKEALSNP